MRGTAAEGVREETEMWEITGVMEKRDRGTQRRHCKRERGGGGFASSRCDRHLYQAVGGGVRSVVRSLSSVLCFTKARGEGICSSLNVPHDVEINVSLRSVVPPSRDL